MVIFFGPILKASTGLLIPKLKPKYFKTTLKFVKIIHKNTTTTKVMSIYISIYIPKDWKFPNYSKKRKWKVPKKIVKVVSVERFFVCPSKIAESQDLTLNGRFWFSYVKKNEQGKLCCTLTQTWKISLITAHLPKTCCTLIEVAAHYSKFAAH